MPNNQHQQRPESNSAQVTRSSPIIKRIPKRALLISAGAIALVSAVAFGIGVGSVIGDRNTTTDEYAHLVAEVTPRALQCGATMNMVSNPDDTPTLASRTSHFHVKSASLLKKDSDGIVVSIEYNNLQEALKFWGTQSAGAYDTVAALLPQGRRPSGNIDVYVGSGYIVAFNFGSSSDTGQQDNLVIQGDVGAGTLTATRAGASIYSSDVQYDLAGNKIIVNLPKSVMNSVPAGKRAEMSVTQREEWYRPSTDTWLYTVFQTCDDRAPSTPPVSNSSVGLFEGNQPTEANCSSGYSCQFSDPAGNYHCVLTPDNASCFASRGEPLVEGLTVPLSTSGGREVPANAITVTKSGSIDMTPITAGTNKMLDRNDMKQYAIPLGTKVSEYGFTCAVAQSAGVSCRHDATAHGFSVSRQKKETF